MNLDLKVVQDQITSLLLAHPDLRDDEVLREDMIEGSTSMHEFLSDLVRKIHVTQAIAMGTAEIIGQLHERKLRFEQREYALRSLIFKVMNTAEIKKTELPEATLSIRNGVPKVTIINETEIPSEFMRVRTEPAKDVIKASLVAGEHVPGAALSNSEPVLSIRTK